MLKIKKEPLIHYMYIYMTIQFIGGRFSAFLGSDIFILLILLLSSIILIIKFNIFKKEVKFIIFLIFISISLVSTSLITMGDLSISTSLALISRFLMVYSTIMINKDKFVERLIKLSFFFACISLILFTVVQLIGENQALNLIFSRSYEIKSEHYWLGSTRGIFLICYNFMNPERNAYMFGEPGEYQMLIMLSLYFLVFTKNNFSKKKQSMYLIIFIITMMTIQSTTGFFNLIAFFICLFFSNNRNISKNVKTILVFCSLLFLLYCLFFINENSFINTQFLNKIFTQEGKLDLSATTGADRVNAINMFMNAVTNHPSLLVFGVGYQGLVKIYNEFSCSGIMNTLIMLGFFTCTILYGFILTNINYEKKIFAKIFLIFMIVNNGLSQPDLLAITTVIIAFYYAFIKNKRNSCKSIINVSTHLTPLE